MPNDIQPSWTAGRRLVAAVAAATLACASLAADPKPEPPIGTAALRDALSRVSVSRSRSGRFVTGGTNLAWNAEILRWAEETDARLARLIGQPAPFTRRGVRFVVLSGHDPKPGVALDHSLGDGRLVQRMTIRGYYDVSPEEADVTLCRMLLNGYAADRLAETQGWPAMLQAAAEGSLPDSPGWLSEGVARVLHEPARAECAAAALDLWESGRAPTPAAILSKHTAPDRPPPEARQMCAMLVEWMNDRADRRACFQRAIETLAARKPLSPEWAADTLAGPLGRLDLAWDRWMIAQRRVVRAPGKPGARDMAEFRRALFFRPPDDASEDGLPTLRPLADLAAADPAWAGSVARERIIRLRLLAAGRGDAFIAAADAYCRFLEAIEQGATPRVLRSLLADANRAVEALEQSAAAKHDQN